MKTVSKIIKQNRDLLERLATEKFETKYLSHDDVLLLAFDDSTASDSFEVLDGLVVVHYNPGTLKIIGLTLPYVIEFLEKLLS